MTEKKQENNSESPSTADFVEEADYNDDKAWNYFPLSEAAKTALQKDFYEIRDAWGYR